MKGLIVKDLAYLKENKLLYAFLIVFGLAFSLFYDNPYFVLGYYSVFAGILTMGTLTHDDLNHGLSFLLTLPITRKKYIQEKYYLGYLLSFTLCLIAFLLATVAQFKETHNFSFFDMEWVAVCFIAMLLFSIMLMTLLIPVQVRFGGEKGQYAMLVVFGTIALLAIIVYFISNVFHLHIEYYIDQIFNINSYILFTIFTLLVVITNFISMKTSMILLEKKEF